MQKPSPATTRTSVGAHGLYRALGGGGSALCGVAVSLASFSLLAKREYWGPSFWNNLNETAAEYTKRVKWDGQPDERLRAMLLVKVHPSLLRQIAPEARIWMEQNWKRWMKDKSYWFTDRWKRGARVAGLRLDAAGAEVAGQREPPPELAQRAAGRSGSCVAPGPASVSAIHGAGRRRCKLDALAAIHD